MSRGIGTRQRLFLAALAKLEAEYKPGGFYVWAIVNAACDLGLYDEATARKARQDAEWAEYQEAERQHRIEVEALAAFGDADAQVELKRLIHLDFLGSAIRSSFRRRSEGSPPQMRDPVDAEHVANPSRTLALLEQRGLIERCPIRGRGASAGLTDAGRIIGRQVLEAMQPA